MKRRKGAFASSIWEMSDQMTTRHKSIQGERAFSYPAFSLDTPRA